MVNILSVNREYILLMGEKNWERSVDFSHLNVKNMCFTPHIVVSTGLNLNYKSGKNHGNVLNTYKLLDRQFEVHRR